ncbi:MAG: hypothetical protein JWO76_178 [Nocardioides sp.]|nr:hypothetical protein [Nocardioides sp.]
MIPAARDRRWRPKRVALVVGALVITLVAAGLGVRWWTHPTVFGGLGDSISMGALPVADAALSTAVIFPKVDGEPETVTISSVHGVFSRNSARASASFSVCHLAAGESPIGSVHDPERYCQDIDPVRAGMSFTQGVAPESDYLFVTLAPTRPGVAHLVRVEVEYARGADHLYQRGTESIRADRKVTAR